MSETARALGQRWFEEVWNQGRREAISEMLPAHAVVHDGPTESRGPEGFYPFFDRIRATFSDMHVTIHDSLAEGDKACVRWSCRMKHTGNGLGIAPTGKIVEITGMAMLRVSGDKVVETWQNWDMLGLMEQLEQRSGPAHTYIGARV